MLRPSAFAHGTVDEANLQLSKAAAQPTASTNAEGTLPLPAVSQHQPTRGSSFRAASSARGVVVGVIVSVCAFGSLTGVACAQLVNLRFSKPPGGSWPRRFGPH